LANLFVELSDQLLLILAGGLWRLEELRQMIANDSFPLRHLHRMHLIFSGNLPDRFDAHQRFQSNLGFEGTCVPLALSSFAHGSAVLSSPAEPEKSNLGYCPKFGVHFCAIGLSGKDGSLIRARKAVRTRIETGWGVRVAAVAGFLMTSLFVVLSVFPIVRVDNAGLFAAKLIAVIGGLQCAGALYYWWARRAFKSRQSTALAG